VLADALVHAAVGVRAGAGPSDHLVVVDGDDERLAVLEPAADVLGGDAGVIDLDHPREVSGLGRTDRPLAERWSGHG
jgi:hypothetical protein